MLVDFYCVFERIGLQVGLQLGLQLGWLRNDKFSLYSSAPGGQKQLLLDFDGLSSDPVYLPDLAAQGIGGGHPAKGLSSSRRRSSFSTQRSGRLYGSLGILDEASDYGYQYA